MTPPARPKSRGYGYGYGRGGFGFGRGGFGYGRGGFGRGGWHRDLEASATKTGPAAWQQEFHLNSRAVGILQSALESGLKGDASRLTALGVDRADVARLGNFEMPSASSIHRVAGNLRITARDLSDFVEVYTIRLKTALASNRE